MRKLMRIALMALPLLVVLSMLTVGGSPRARADDEGDLQALLDSHQDLSSLTVNAGAFPAGPTSPTGTGHPPRVGPNVRINDPQQGFPAGLFGRSETSIASTDDGQFLVAGFNDAQGFLRAAVRGGLHPTNTVWPLRLRLFQQWRRDVD